MRTRQRQTRPDGRPVKADYLFPAELQRLARTPFVMAVEGGTAPGACSTCGADISNEYLFAAHYVLAYGPQYLGLGNCPRD